MKRVVVLGRGGAGKSTLCRRPSVVTGIPVIELDKLYWDQSLSILTQDEWGKRQSEVSRREQWIMDGDLGPYDVLAPRLTEADTVVIVNTALVICLWRALRRGRQRMDFWTWVLRWGSTYRPQIMAEVARHAPNARVVELKRTNDTDRFLATFTEDSSY